MQHCQLNRGALVFEERDTEGFPRYEQLGEAARVDCPEHRRSITQLRDRLRLDQAQTDGLKATVRTIMETRIALAAIRSVGDEDAVPHLHTVYTLSLIHISEPTRQAEISYAVFCL